MMDKRMKPFTPVMEKDVEVSVVGDVVRIEIHCGDAYEAQLLQEDFTERLQAGRHIAITMVQAES